VSSAPRIHVHLVAWTDEPWDLEESLFSLVTQEDVALSVSIAVSVEDEGFARGACARFSRLGRAVELGVGTPATWSPGTAAVAVWVGGTLAAPDHLARALVRCRADGAIAVAPARRVLRRSVPGQPPYVVRKTRRFTSVSPSLDELGRDPAFLGRCLVPTDRAPSWVPASPDEHHHWAAEAWPSGPVARVVGPPSVDLPDLRTWRGVRSLDDVRDALSELRYQGPRWLERRAPSAFGRIRGWYHWLRGGAH